MFTHFHVNVVSLFFFKCVLLHPSALNAGESGIADRFMDYFIVAEEEKNRD